MNRRIGFLVVAVMVSIHCVGQVSVLNNNRPEIKWKQINTEDFKILFPEGFEREGQRMANTLQHIHDPIDKSLQTKTRKATIVLQNQNSIANGFVAMGPRRSEFYTSAPQDYNFLGTNDWLNTLAVHEYRHLAQFNKSRTGFNNFFYYLFGQNTQGAWASIAAPPWFFEGDATVTESVFTHSGRGRIPAFDRVFRANLLGGKEFGYHKQLLRSYKDFVPNHYVLGYHMVTHIRKKTNQNHIFADVTKKAWGVPFVPFTFSNALRNTTGKYVVSHYKDMLDELKKEWREQIKDTKLTTFETITYRSDDTFTNYSNPVQMANGRILTMKLGIGDIQQFVLVGAKGEEEVMHIPGIVNNSGMLSVASNSVVWNEYEYDPRWRNQSYSVIKTYNYDTETLKTLTKKSRYHGASLSPNAREVATIEASQFGGYQLVILDARTGEVVTKYENTTQGLLTLPSWSEDGQHIIFLSNKDEEKSVQIIDLATGAESVLIPNGYENIGNPKLYGKYLIYQSDYSGIDNIYAYNIDTKQRYQITSSKYGAYNASLSNDGKTIYYSDHTVNGLDIVSMPYDPNSWIALEDVNVNKLNYFQTAVKQEGYEDILENVPSKQYAIKKYSRLKGLINPHSWGPFVNTNNLNNLQAGIFSKDVLSTTSLFAGYNYNSNTRTGGFLGRLSYQGWYPIIDLEYQKGSRTNGSIKWDEQTVEAGLRIPLVLTKSKFIQELTFGNSIGATEVSNFRNEGNPLGRFLPAGTGKRLVQNPNTGIIDTVDVPLIRLTFLNNLSNGNLTFNHFQTSYFLLMKRSLRDINSKFGLTLTYERFDRLSGDFVGKLSALRYQLFLPGLMRHHSFHIRGGIQSRLFNDATNLYTFNNRIFVPRGYSYFTSKSFSSALVNYTLPLWYPDLNLGPLVNIKRVKLNAFADFGAEQLVFHFLEASNMQLFSKRELAPKYASFGAELTFDINVMRALPELEIGFRYVYNNEVQILNINIPAKSKFELIIGNISF